MIDDAQLVHWFTYHAPAGDDRVKYEEIRRAGLTFARAIIQNTPPGADQSDCVRKIRETVMTANAAVACGGK